MMEMSCKEHPGCLYDVLCNCDNCDKFTEEIILNIWKRFFIFMNNIMSL